MRASYSAELVTVVSMAILVALLVQSTMKAGWLAAWASTTTRAG